MALVGSLVFFLIEVLYVGEYEARLNYAFALFVFAAVLIAPHLDRNGLGAGRAVRVAAGHRDVSVSDAVRRASEPVQPPDQSGADGRRLVVRHKLTWDSTVIDDDEDSSGEGLMQRIGVDGPDAAEESSPRRRRAIAMSCSNRLPKRLPLKSHGGDVSFVRKKRRHIAGLWVLYFSLAALPLFGIGQSWIPVAGRRPPPVRIHFAAGLRRRGAHVAGDDKLSGPAPIFAPAADRDAESDRRNVGRNRRARDRARDVPRAAHSATSGRSRHLTSAVAGWLAGRTFAVALQYRKRWPARAERRDAKERREQ